MRRANSVIAGALATSWSGVALATTQELVDFTILPANPVENVRAGSLTVEDYPLPVVENSGVGAFDHSLSLAFERSMDEPNSDRPQYKQVTFTFPLGAKGFNFPMPDHEVSLWFHVDGPPAIVPGASPYSKGEVRPEMVRIRLKGQGKTFTSAKQRVSRGWNELRFCLTSLVTPPRNQVDYNNRVVHFTPENETGSLIDSIQIVFDGTHDCGDSGTVGKIRLNTCRLQPVRPCSIVMVYDDGWTGFMNLVFPTLKSLKMPATVAVVKDFVVGQRPYHMSLSDLQTVFGYSYFNSLGAKTYLVDLVNHTATHARLHGEASGQRRNYRTAGTTIGVYDDIAEGKRFLLDNKLTRGGSESLLVYPGGSSDAQVYMAMEQLGIRFGRTVSCERNQNSQGDSLRNPFAGETYDAARAENSVDIFQSHHPLDELFDWIDEGILSGRNRFIMWHDVMESLPEFDANGRAADGHHTVYNVNSLAFHEQVLAYIQARRGLKCTVKTVPGWYQSLTDLQKVPGFHF